MSEAGRGDQVSISTHVSDRLLCLSVADNGPGIPNEIASRIFDPLFTTKKGGKGTGVGLAFCHRIMSGHNGAIRLDAVAGPGATFVLEIPVHSS